MNKHQVVGIDKDLIISVKEARKLLGADFKFLSDDDVVEIIQNLDYLAKVAFKQNKENK